MTWNPHGAYPRQSTYTPDVGMRVLRAVNAPNFGAVGTGSGPRQLPLDAAYMNIARNAAGIAGGAAGVGAHIRGLAAREGAVTGGVVDNLHRRGAQARSQMMRGLRSNGPADEVYARGADVVASAMTPISVTWDPETAPPLIQGRPNQPWDSLLEPGREPAFDPMGRRDPSTMNSTNRPQPKVTSRGRPQPRQVTDPFKQSLF